MNGCCGGCRWQAASVVVLGLAFFASSAFAADDSAAVAPALPHCAHPYGAMAIHPPADDWWDAWHLESPVHLLNVYVVRSGCFTVVSRGAGLQAAEEERALASQNQLRAGSQMGGGQMVAADYVLVPDIVNRNRNAGGTHIGGFLGGLLGHHLGGVGSLAAGVDLQKKSADVTLTLTDVRTTVEVASTEGRADKTSIGWSGSTSGYGGFLGGFGDASVSSYTNTEIGQVVAAAYLQAYLRLVTQVEQRNPSP